jgi:three-Cys-motif partner protein
LLGTAEASKGSALKVFELRNQGRTFDRFVFGDRSPTKLQELRKAVSERFPDRASVPEIEFHAELADTLISKECTRMGSADRAVMFLDPFGMQVSWSSIQQIAASGKIDLWYLAPTGIAINRLMKLRGNIPEPWRRRLDEALGGSGWLEALYDKGPQDLLGHRQVQRESGYEPLITYFEAQWTKLFGGGALPHGLRLRRGNQLPYLLCFACSNPSGAARKPALAIAKHLIETARHGELL